MGAHQFIHSLRKHQIADLRPDIKAFRLIASDRVPEANSAVSSSTAWNQQTVLMWWPGKSLHSCSVAQQVEGGGARMETPNIQAIIVASRR